MPKPLLLFLVVALGLVAAVVLWPRKPLPPPLHFGAIVDTSDSMPSDIEGLVTSAIRECIRQPLQKENLVSGATVDIFVVGANELTEPFHLEIPRPGDDLASDIEHKKALKSAGPAIEAFVKRVVSGRRAGATNLIETLERLPVYPNPGVFRLLVVSDGRQATAKLNVETTKITNVNLDKLVRTALAIGPLPSFVDNALIQFNLPALAPDVVDKSLNDTRSLRRFWTAYFEAAAPRSTLINYDARVVDWSDRIDGVN